MEQILRHRRALLPVVVLASVLATGWLAWQTPAAQAVNPATPRAHTIDYAIISTGSSANFITQANIDEMTRQVSAGWQRISRGAVTAMTVGHVVRVPNFPSVDAFCNMGGSSIPAIISQALGYSTAIYSREQTGRHLVILASVTETTACTKFAGMAIETGASLNYNGVFLARYQDPTSTAAVFVHELGHIFGLSHASAVDLPCIPRYWDGPFLDQEGTMVGGCPMAGPSGMYRDYVNVTGGSNTIDNLDINGHQKYLLGLIQPGQGMIEATATTADQTLTIHDTHTADPTLPQTIRLTTDDPDGDGPCAAPVYAIDYDPKLGGVRIYHVTTKLDCGSYRLDNGIMPGTIAWSVPWGGGSYRSFFLPGEARLTASGGTEIRVVSADPATGTAVIGFRRTGPDHPALQLTSTLIGYAPTAATPTGATMTGVVTTDQPAWTASADQPWVTVTARGTTGGTLTVDVAPNATTSERTAVVTLVAGVAVRTYEITQEGAGGSVTSDCGQTVASHCTWANLAEPVTGMSEAVGDKDWFKITPAESGMYVFTTSDGPTAPTVWSPVLQVFTADGSLIFAVRVTGAPGAGNQKRLTVSLTAGETYYLELGGYVAAGSYTLTATRAATQVSLSPGAVTAAPTGETLTFTVSASGSWEMLVPAWASVNPQLGSGSREVTVTIPPNVTGEARASAVSVWTTEQVAWASLTQETVVDDCGGSFGSHCTWADLSSTVSGRIEVSGDRDWYLVRPTVSGTWMFQGSAPAGGITNTMGVLYPAGSASAVAYSYPVEGSHFGFTTYLVAGKNYFLEVSSRAASGAYTVMAVPGPGPSIAVLPTDPQTRPEGNRLTFEVGAVGSWTATGPDWATLSQTSGTGPATITATLSANTSGKTRFGDLAFVAGGVTARVTLMQLALPDEPVVADDCGGSVTANCVWADTSVEASGRLEAVGDRDWFKITPSESGWYAFASARATVDPVRDTKGYLLASDGRTMLASDDNGPENHLFNLAAELTAGQTYYLVVTSEDQLGNYTLTSYRR